MDITEMISSKWLTANDVKNSNSKTIVIVGEGNRTEGVNPKGEKYPRLVLPVQLDGASKDWIPNSNSIKKLSQKFNSKETKDWIGKPVRVTTMFVQGGKEGITLVD